MGLDMYFTKRKQKEDTEVGYLRKANQIHFWLVENIQNGTDNCEEYEFHKEQILELKSIIEKILKESKLIKGKVANGYSFKDGEKIYHFEDGEVIEDSKVAEELLPSTDGFFFGGTNYDQWYIEDLKEAHEILDKILEETDFETEKIIYQSSW